MRPFLSLLVGSAFLTFVAVNAQAEENYTITIKDHQFSPASLELPAGKRVRVTIDNQDPTAEEFESHELNREKIISGNSKGTVFIGPLEPGTYKYFGEFHEKTAQGVIVVK